MEPTAARYWNFSESNAFPGGENPGAALVRTWPRRYSTKFRLFGLVAAVVIPLIAFGALVVYRYAIAEQAQVERQAVRIARQTGLLIEADLKQLIARLEGLIASSALNRDDIQQFHAEAARFTRDRAETIILRDMGTRHLFNSGLPYGAPLPEGPAFSQQEKASYDAGRPWISDVYLSPRNQEPRIVVALPIMRDGSPRYVIGTTIPTRRIHDAILPGLPAGYVVAVGDRKGTYIARSERHEDFTGKPGLPEYVRQVTGPQGSFRSPNFAGSQLLAGYYRSDLTGWFFTANIPVETVEQPLQISLLRLAGFGAAALVVSALLALLFSREITSSTQQLVQRAHQLGRNHAVEPLQTRLTEFAQINAALASAGQQIAARAHERERASEREALLASIFDAVGVHVGVVIPVADDFRFVAANRAAASMFADAGTEIVGVWAQKLKIGSDDRQAFARLLMKSVKASASFTDEFTLRTPDGQGRTWLGTFTALPVPPGEYARVVFTAMDISERKRAEVQRQLLVNELNHRVKNSLAIAQSIASQTLRTARTPQDARNALSQRLVSLAHTHDVLTRENWEGADVEDIVDHVIEPWRAGGRVTATGPTVRLQPGAALTLSLLLHELLTNSVKHGALSSDDGTVAIEWHLDRAGGQPRLRLTLKEANGPEVKPPAHKGFGSRLIEASFSSPEEGRVAVSYAPTGVVCEIEMGAQLLAGSPLDGAKRL